MKEIKFRGHKCQGGGKWIYGNCLIQNSAGTRYIANDIAPSKTSEENYSEVVHVCQFTGIKDANGKEIYEGDIFGTKKIFPDRFIRVVEYIDDGFYLIDNCEGRKYGEKLKKEISTDTNFVGVTKFLNQHGLEYGIIGNIYDNPELIESEAKK